MIHNHNVNIILGQQHVSSAGIDDVPPEQVERLLKTNVVGYALMAREAAARMTAPGGSIVNTVSVEAYEGMASMVPYAASKVMDG